MIVLRNQTYVLISCKTVEALTRHSVFCPSIPLFPIARSPGRPSPAMDATMAFTSGSPTPTRFYSSALLSLRTPKSLSVYGPWRWRERGRPLLALRHRSQAQAAAAAAGAAEASHHDVVVVGAGIVGLAIARHLLLHTSLSVAIADAAVPCSGATGAGTLPSAPALMLRCFRLYGVGCNTSFGEPLASGFYLGWGSLCAGQGYIWMSHRTPGTDTWELALRSKQLWEELATEVDGQGGGGAREKLGWMRTGNHAATILRFIASLSLYLKF